MTAHLPNRTPLDIQAEETARLFFLRAVDVLKARDWAAEYIVKGAVPKGVGYQGIILLNVRGMVSQWEIPANWERRHPRSMKDASLVLLLGSTSLKPTASDMNIIHAATTWIDEERRQETEEEERERLDREHAAKLRALRERFPNGKDFVFDVNKKGVHITLDVYMDEHDAVLLLSAMETVAWRKP